MNHHEGVLLQQEVVIETITPEMAEKYLVHNLINRKIRETVIVRFAEMMGTHQWAVGGSTIDFDVDGNLVNGQHRLRACIRAGVPFTTIIVRGVARDAQVIMDTGLHRKLADILSFKGEVSSVALAAAINLGWRRRIGKVTQTVVPSHLEALAWLDKNPSIRDGIRRTTGFRELSCPPSPLAVFAHQIVLVDDSEADAFLKALRDGDQLAVGDPVLVLRNWMINQITRRASGLKPPTFMYLAIMIKGWNAWVTGRSMQQLVWRRGGRAREEFPELLDLDGNVVPITDEITDEGPEG